MPFYLKFDFNKMYDKIRCDKWPYLVIGLFSHFYLLFL